jgi:hypothetical protein
MTIRPFQLCNTDDGGAIAYRFVVSNVSTREYDVIMHLGGKLYLRIGKIWRAGPKLWCWASGAYVGSRHEAADALIKSMLVRTK